VNEQLEKPATESLAEQVKRDSCPLRRSFVQRSQLTDELTPLTRLLRTPGEAGGKGAGLRIGLYLSLIWICAREPYSTSRVAPYWAELLSREDPGGEGARAIRDCLHDLESRGLIELRAQKSRIEISLNLETSAPGAATPYRPPYGETAEPYLSIPRSFWTSGIAGQLSGAGAAMYLVALAMTRHDDPKFFITGEFFDDRFGISRSSRKRGLAELVKLGVLSVEILESPDLVTFRKMRRNLYTVAPAFLEPAPWIDPAEELRKAAAEKEKTAAENEKKRVDLAARLGIRLPKTTTKHPS
jgi:hypothetical protein